MYVPTCSDMAISKVLKEYQHLFKTTPGITTLAYQHAYSKQRQSNLCITMQNSYLLQNNKSNSKFIRCIKDIMLWSWMAPAVFILKKAGDIYLCVDYRE